jgi:hypothetical protein
MRTPEAWEKDEIANRLKLLKPEIWFYRPLMAGYGPSGVSDIVGFYRGKGFVVEVKRPGKQPTPIQWRRMEDAEAAGGKAFWGTAAKVIPEFEAWTA